MNMSQVLRRVKLRLGLAVIPTPFGDGIEQEIIDIVENDTIPTFSIYHPFKVKERINLRNLKQIPDGPQLGDSVSHSTYLLEDEMVKNLLYVLDLNYADMSVVSTDYFGLPMGYLGGVSAQNMMLGNAAMQLGQMMIPKPTFHYEHPKTLTIYGQYITNDFILDLGYVHDKSLVTIEEAARDSFLDLALLDVKTNLYPTMKQYTEINSPLGNINLKLDDWADAESKREELINKWDESYLLDLNVPYYA